jgi:hypothetical protein
MSKEKEKIAKEIEKARRKLRDIYIKYTKELHQVTIKIDKYL